MSYAKIRDGIVENILSLRRSQEKDFPDCVDAGDLPVSIGDTYDGGRFYRHGEIVRTELQKAGEQLQKADEQLQVTAAAALSTVQDACRQTGEPPRANAGIFVRGAIPWEAGKAYERFDLFCYNGAVGWVKQAHTSQENWLPFAAGTEALYGARPAPDKDGVYPYVYNMAAEKGMRVRENGVIYVCIQATDDLLWPPSQVPALFQLSEEVTV